MLHINDLTYRIEGRLLFDKATAGIPAGHKVGIVGRNGTGKTTLLRMLTGEIAPDDGSISWPKTATMGGVAQEAPSGPQSLIDTVLAADKERDSLLAEAETATDPGRIAEIQLRLHDIGAHSAPSRAAQILAGLGFDEAAQQRPCAEFSGGWRMRVALASVLFTAPDILLLDEPTNYLDLEGTMWLENFLGAYPHTVLIVSHDRDLLNKCVGAILHLSNNKLTLYSGGYDTFEETRRERQRLELKLKKKQDDARRHMEAFVERFRAKASKASQAQSRLKALAKMQPIAAEIDNDVRPLRFPSPQTKLGNPLIQLEAASVGYADTPVLRNLNLRLDSDDRIGLLGANGNGKSTLAKLLSGRLDTLSGHRGASKKLTVGYFAQHQLDELNPQKSAYEHIAAMMPDKTEAQKRARAAAAGFGADKADTLASKLSGGEKARLLFALAAFNAPHLLILDEPTNHLDVDSREALIHGLNDYEGAVILISHDRHLIEATADRLWLVRDGTVVSYDGDLESYKNEFLARARDQKRGGRSSANGQAAGRNRQEDRRAAATARAELAPLKKRIDSYEREIKEITKRIVQLDAELAGHGLYEEPPEKALRLMKDRGVLTKSLGEAEILWLEACERYERAKGEQQSAGTV